MAAGAVAGGAERAVGVLAEPGERGVDVGDRYDPEVTDQAFEETVALFRRALPA